MIGFQSNIVAGTVLVRSAIQSPNYVAGTTGWTINQDGSVEFNNATIRGTITAGNGTVRLNAGGVKVDGVLYQFDINFTGGFLARRVPDDGGYAQMNMLVADGRVGGGTFYNPTEPTTGGNTFSTTGAVYASSTNVAGVEAPYLVVRSPILTGKTGANIFMYGEDSTSATPPRLSINGNVAIHGSNEQYTLIDTLHLTSSGNFDKTAYPGARRITVSIVGGGGAGGGASATGAGQWSFGDGGGGGEFAQATYDLSLLNNLTAYTVGAGGTGVSGAAGNDGGTTTFSAAVGPVSAIGGGGAAMRPATSSVGTWSQNTNSREGGTGGTGGHIRFGGGPGGSGQGFSSGLTGIRGGDGGSSYFAGGRVGSVGAGGGTGKTYGGGGSGASQQASGAAVAGGNGGAGIVIIEIYA